MGWQEIQRLDERGDDPRGGMPPQSRSQRTLRRHDGADFRRGIAAPVAPYHGRVRFQLHEDRDKRPARRDARLHARPGSGDQPTRKVLRVCDRWHASAPNQTWPNRFFVHTGTAAGYVNNSPVRFPYLMPTIFNRLTQRQRSWRVYFHDVPLTATLSNILSELPERLYPFEDAFMSDAMAGRLPDYSFIEPRYFPSIVFNRMPNDQHPPHNVAYGERLIARCYDALRNSPGWEHTLFIVIYDEHGGVYDHVPPPEAVLPDDACPDGFRFDRYGVRVPAVLISPWIPAGSIVRPPAGSQYPFDHASILSTLRKLFDLGDPLTRRDAAAPDLLAALSLTSPSNSGPASLAFPTAAPSADEIASAHRAPPNDLQQAILQLASALPTGSAALATHLDLLDSAKEQLAVTQCATVGDVLLQVEKGFSRFLRTPRL